MDAIITLTSDFGEDSPYAAALKGVILAVNPQARLIDLSHSIPPQDIQHAAFFLEEAIPLFPKEALHVVVVDPGVGTERPILYVEVGGHRLIAPDNGCWTLLLGCAAEPPRVIRLEERRYWRQPVSKTFHGRDIMAPVAAHLSLGVPPEQLGPPAATWVTLKLPEPIIEVNRAVGSVVFIDHFGNLITNLREKDVATLGKRLVFRVGPVEVNRFVDAYARALAGEGVALYSSSGRLEFAVVQGNAAAKLDAKVGTQVEVISR
jgi:S-adenosyl-L-methionine hydrolase (adenosine-forming)